MDFIFCCPDGSHVPVDTVHPSLFRSSSLSSPRIFLPMYSWSRLLTCPNHLNLAFLHLSVMFSTFSLSLMLSFLTRSLSVWPHARLHFCHFQFRHVGASHWHGLHSWLNDRLAYLSLHVPILTLLKLIQVQFTNLYSNNRSCELCQTTMKTCTIIILLPAGQRVPHTTCNTIIKPGF